MPEKTQATTLEKTDTTAKSTVEIKKDDSASKDKDLKESGSNTENAKEIATVEGSIEKEFSEISQLTERLEKSLKGLQEKPDKQESSTDEDKSTKNDNLTAVEKLAKSLEIKKDEQEPITGLSDFIEELESGQDDAVFNKVANKYFPMILDLLQRTEAVTEDDENPDYFDEAKSLIENIFGNIPVKLIYNPKAHTLTIEGSLESMSFEEWADINVTGTVKACLDLKEKRLTWPDGMAVKNLSVSAFGGDLKISSESAELIQYKQIGFAGVKVVNPKIEIQNTSDGFNEYLSSANLFGTATEGIIDFFPTVSSSLGFSEVILDKINGIKLVKPTWSTTEFSIDTKFGGAKLNIENQSLELTPEFSIPDSYEYEAGKLNGEDFVSFEPSALSLFGVLSLTIYGALGGGFSTGGKMLLQHVPNTKIWNAAGSIYGNGTLYAKGGVGLAMGDMNLLGAGVGANMRGGVDASAEANAKTSFEIFRGRSISETSLDIVKDKSSLEGSFSGTLSVGVSLAGKVTILARKKILEFDVLNVPIGYVYIKAATEFDTEKVNKNGTIGGHVIGKPEYAWGFGKDTTPRNILGNLEEIDKNAPLFRAKLTEFKRIAGSAEERRRISEGSTDTLNKMHYMVFEITEQIESSKSNITEDMEKMKAIYEKALPHVKKHQGRNEDFQHIVNSLKAFKESTDKGEAAILDTSFQYNNERLQSTNKKAGGLTKAYNLFTIAVTDTNKKSELYDKLIAIDEQKGKLEELKKKALILEMKTKLISGQIGKGEEFYKQIKSQAPQKNEAEIKKILDKAKDEAVKKYDQCKNVLLKIYKELTKIKKELGSLEQEKDKKTAKIALNEAKNTDNQSKIEKLSQKNDFENDKIAEAERYKSDENKRNQRREDVQKKLNDLEADKKTKLAGNKELQDKAANGIKEKTSKKDSISSELQRINDKITILGKTKAKTPEEEERYNKELEDFKSQRVNLNKELEQNNDALADSKHLLNSEVLAAAKIENKFKQDYERWESVKKGLTVEGQEAIIKNSKKIIDKNNSVISDLKKQIEKNNEINKELEKDLIDNIEKSIESKKSEITRLSKDYETAKADNDEAKVKADDTRSALNLKSLNTDKEKSEKKTSSIQAEIKAAEEALAASYTNLGIKNAIGKDEQALTQEAHKLIYDKLTLSGTSKEKMGAAAQGILDKEQMKNIFSKRTVSRSEEKIAAEAKSVASKKTSAPVPPPIRIEESLSQPVPPPSRFSDDIEKNKQITDASMKYVAERINLYQSEINKMKTAEEKINNYIKELNVQKEELTTVIKGLRETSSLPDTELEKGDKEALDSIHKADTIIAKNSTQEEKNDKKLGDSKQQETSSKQQLSAFKQVENVIEQQA